MQLADFSYPLPDELIAQEPLPSRSASRLLHVGATLTDRSFQDLPALLRAGDLLVFNDTRVIPARVFGTKTTGGQVEILLERVIDERRIIAQVRASKALRSEVAIVLPGGVEAHFVGRRGDLFELALSVEPIAYFQRFGALPLPPYIDRAPNVDDSERYQTVYANELGAVAAPTAGLHFDAEILAACRARGVEMTYLTLHVGAGTYQPVRVTNLDEHRMHVERARVPQAVVDCIQRTRERGGRVIAVGTTVVRALETAAQNGELCTFDGDTNIFIRPGFEFRVIDLLLTNFHLPESTLLMLVCAFGGYERVMHAYRHAVAARYRFFSYGDAMLVTPASSREDSTL